MRNKKHAADQPAAGAQPETPTALLEEIHDHPANPRIDAVADDEMVDSIRAVGVLDPVMVAPGPDGGWTLIDGHRRKDGALKAGLVDVPIHPRYDLVTEAQQIEAMVITGLQKALLTPVEEARGYEQLALLGMDEAAIAASTGFPVRRVKERMRLNALPDMVRAKLHDGDASLVDVAALDEFADDPTPLAELEEVLGTDNFQHTLHTLRGRRDRTVRRAATIAEFEAAGAVRAVSVPGTPGKVTGADAAEHSAHGMHSFPEDLRDPAAHDGCLAVVVPDYDFSDPYLVCIDRTRHPSAAPAAPPSPVTSDWEKQRAARAERAALRDAAAATRLGWLREHFTGMFPVRGAGPLAAAVRAFLPLLVIDRRDVPDPEMRLRGLDVVPADTSYPTVLAAQQTYAASLAAATNTTALAGLAGYLAALVAEQMDPVEEPQFMEDLAELQYALSLWDWAKAAGYSMSDVDKDLRTALEVRHTELAAEAEEAAAS